MNQNEEKKPFGLDRDRWACVAELMREFGVLQMEIADDIEKGDFERAFSRLPITQSAAARMAKSYGDLEMLVRQSTIAAMVKP